MSKANLNLKAILTKRISVILPDIDGLNIISAEEWIEKYCKENEFYVAEKYHTSKGLRVELVKTCSECITIGD
jgi:hypothetical protein